MCFVPRLLPKCEVWKRKGRRDLFLHGFVVQMLEEVVALVSDPTLATKAYRTVELSDSAIWWHYIPTTHQIQ